MAAHPGYHAFHRVAPSSAQALGGGVSVSSRESTCVPIGWGKVHPQSRFGFEGATLERFWKWMRCALILGLSIAQFGCARTAREALAPVPEAPTVSAHLEGPPPKLLSAYNLFLDGPAQIPNAGVVPYDLTTPLFSDYAEKHRFVYVPEGAPATYTEDGPFEFPVGSVLVKTFSYYHDARDPSLGERLIETRLLIHKPSGWAALPYVWNAAQTDAELKVAGSTTDVDWIHTDGAPRHINYVIPNMNDCKACHEIGKTLQPIGPKARNLNKDYAYDRGTENQLEHWVRAGVLNDAPAPKNAPRLAVWDDPKTGSLDQRARAWLDVNCAHCHNPVGPASTSGLDLRYTQHEPVNLGLMMTPVAAGIGSGKLYNDIVPGKPDESILVYRISSMDPGVMMPEVPRRLVHDEGVALIREWIGAMEPRDPATSQ